MSSTLWSERYAGQDFSVGLDEETDGAFLVFGEPDHIRTPPELGSIAYRVVSIETHRCPCMAHDAKAYTLEGTDLRVSHCPTKGYLWWKPR